MQGDTLELGANPRRNEEEREGGKWVPWFTVAQRSP
jgi:hypothetical protein